MAKFDLMNAFRLCPVRRADWPLLCFLWESSYFVHVALPFGSRFSPLIFNRFAQVLWWLLPEIGSVGNLILYLDEFSFASAAIEVGWRDLRQPWSFVLAWVFLFLRRSACRLLGRWCSWASCWMLSAWWLHCPRRSSRHCLPS